MPPPVDFLVRFRAETSQALSAVNAFYTRVNQVNTLINQSMGRGGSAQLFGGVAQSANQATAAIGSTFQVMGRISQLARRSTTGLNAADKEISKLATNFITLRDSMRIDKGGGFVIGEDRIRNASRLLTQLQTAAGLSADQVDNLKKKLDVEFGSGFRIDEQFRAMPARLAKMSQEASNAMGKAFGGGFSTSAAELRSLDTANRKLLELQRNGQDVSGDLARVATRINQVSAAAANTRSLTDLNKKFAALDATLGKSGGMTRSNITQLRDYIKQMQALGGVGAGADPRINRMGPIIEAQFRALPGAIDPAIAKMRAFTQTMREQIALANQFQTPTPSARGVVNAFDQSLSILKTPGLNPDIYREAATNARAFADQLGRFPPGLNETARAFGTHARRIAEGIILYDAFGRALQAVSGQIKLIGDLAREQIRFEAVVGDLGPGGDSRFLEGIGDVAVRTNTQLSDLASIMDTVAFATDQATSATDRQAESLTIMSRIGEFTNVTQRDLQTETENLIGIMNTFNLSLEDWENSLGGIVTMGGNSSRAIQAIVDTLSGAGRAAQNANIDLETLGAIGVEVFRKLQGAMSGNEISSQLNTILGKLADPDVQANIESLTNGVIRFRDANGQLRDGNVVYEELFSLLGSINDEARATLMDQFIPPLNPGAASFVKVMIDTLPQAMQSSEEGAKATGDALANLSELLVSGPAEQFSKAIIAMQVAFTELFREDVAGGMNAIAEVFAFLAGVLSTDIGADIVGLTVKFVAFFALLRGAQVALRGAEILFLGSGRRVRELDIAMSAAGVSGDSFVDTTTNAGTSAQKAGGRIDTMRTSVRNLAGALAKPMLLLVAFEIVTSVPDIVDSFKAQLNQELSSGLVDRGTLDAAFGELTNIEVLGMDLTSFSRFDFIFGNAAAAARGLSEIQFQNVENLARAMIQLDKEGKLSAAAQRALDEAITGVDGKVSNQLVSYEELMNAYNSSIIGAHDLTGAQESLTEGWRRGGEEAFELGGAIDELTAAEERSAEATRINVGLSDVRAQEIERLTEQLRNGAITLDEFTSAQDNLGTASETASAFVAAFGDQLDLIPGLLERMSATGESAGEALTNILIANPETVDQQIDILNRMIEIMEIAEEASTAVAENPVTPVMNTKPLADATARVLQTFGLLDEARRAYESVPITPQVDLRVLSRGMQNALRMFGILGQAQALVFSKMGSTKSLGSLPKGGGSTSNVLSGLMAELAALGESVGVVNNILKYDPRLSGSGGSDGPSQTGIIDIGDLPASSISQIIGLALEAQRRVVAAGGVVDADETVALFKDASFQQLISGLDQRFLQQAIEELTEVERRRLELEQARLQDVTRSLVTQVGPIQSITSAPILAAGGGVLSGQGLNADPRLGNFTINVPINWSGMNLAQLQQFITNSIAQAWIDAGRGS